jgi:DNA-binding response OmpR family regulator
MRILIVEDNPRIAGFLQKGLREEGYVVEVAADGDAAFEKATTQGFDAAVVDVMIPGRTGVELVRDLREREIRLPVLLLTARDRTEDKVAGLDAGADDYLTKPFDLGELKARLRALTRRGTEVRPEQIALGPLVLDRPAQEIRVGSAPLGVTPKEHALLEYFMLHAGELVTRTDLLENAWDMNFDPQSNVIDAHVARLRAKLRAHPDAPQLETVRGLGFRLVISSAREPGAE